jgi:hypothetical protein
MRVDGKGIAFKLRNIFVPLLALSVSFLAGYSLLNWLLVARSGLIPVSDNVVEYWLPLGVSWILVLMFIQPRIGLLKRDAKGNLTFLYQFAAVAFVAVPTIIAQGYIRTVTGDITYVGNAGDITSAAATKYYSANKICVSYKDALFEPVVSTSGRNNETLNVDVYAVEPVCSNMLAIPGMRSVWIGLKAHTNFSNSLDQSDKEARYRAFLNQADTQFRGEDPNSYRFLERMGRNADGKGFAAALRRARAFTVSPSAVVLVPHREPFEQRTGMRLQWVFGSCAIGAIVWLGLALICPLDHARVRQWLEPGRGKGPAERVKSLRLLFATPRRLWAPDPARSKYPCVRRNGVGRPWDGLVRYSRLAGLGCELQASASRAWSAAPNFESICPRRDHASSRQSVWTVLCRRLPHINLPQGGFDRLLLVVRLGRGYYQRNSSPGNSECRRIGSDLRYVWNPTNPRRAARRKNRGIEEAHFG